ncbi:helix-turn-helix domain-containing protein [Bacillus sp. JCM 19034]|uniref:helix-turn-helix domain-containing protein n=1 Tax=Bacillus sp. JCM 19034 TaxID=1481928 RepID=UPI000782BFFB|nr:helix-turn-helix transcriptional regulator [Bacillus sp. JCM 19034]
MKFNHCKLREARGQKKLTLEDMAKSMNMDLSAYWRLEQGKTKVKAEQLIKLMMIFDRPYTYFFESSNPIHTIQIEVDCIPEKLQLLYGFLKGHPGIVNNWEQNLLKLEQELHSISF